MVKTSRCTVKFFIIFACKILPNVFTHALNSVVKNANTLPIETKNDSVHVYAYLLSYNRVGNKIWFSIR